MDVFVHGSQTIEEKIIAGSVAEGDNYAAAILVSLLVKLVEQESHEHDIVTIVNFMEKAIDTIDTGSSKEPVLFDYDEGANAGESLIFALLQYYFYLRR